VHYLENIFITQDMSVLEVLEVSSKYETNIIPVLSQSEKEYLGYAEIGSIIRDFGETPFMSEYGTVIIVQNGINDHSFSKISQIVESNNTKILGVYISDITNDVVETTLKVGNGDINTILQTFRRYGYQVVIDHVSDVLLSNLKDRSRYFNRYLNI